ncbi:YidC/Oxa1 family membrane protein insertase [Christensenellaceae bacterium OttesenSCG-928-K19]|nr:YidC/Oxa1 family membrane protein insertase [Christensenellaceae bacterium OttesenSCG-928-K19]
MEFLYNNFIADFFYWCLKGLEFLFSSYPVAIIVLTILIRLALLPLDLRQKNNQRRMSELGPEINSLKKRYANNPQQLQRKQQELYRKRGVRPMAGCIPMIIQLPILFAFFGAMRLLAAEQTVGVLLDAAEYGADTVALPSFAWINNFWQPDAGHAPIFPDAANFLSFVQQYSSNISAQALMMMKSQGILIYADNVVTVGAEAYSSLTSGIIVANGVEGVNNGWYILPALSGAALFLQQKFSPQSANAMGGNPMMPVTADDQSAEQQQAQGCSQKVMMWVMPIFSIYICIQSNAAFALYWFVSSLYAFLQGRVVDLVRKKQDEKRKKEKEIIIS